MMKKHNLHKQSTHTVAPGHCEILIIKVIVS